jgi:hypothetical protein
LSQISNQISKVIDERLAAIGIKPVAGAEAEDTAAEKPVLSEAQKIKLDKAKYRMDRAEKSLKEYQALKNKFFTKWFVGVSSLKAETEVERERQAAGAEYERLKKEFGV